MALQDWSRRDFLNAAASAGVVFASGSALAGPELLARLLGVEENLSPLDKLIASAPLARYWVSAQTAVTASDCASCHLPGKSGSEEKYQHKTQNVACLLCAQNCVISEGERGKCRTRINVAGELRTLSYGRPISVHIDPIEKKPLYHFLPGRTAYSLATAGCPLRCKFCQNWEISQARPEDHAARTVSPQRIAQAVTDRRVPVIAFTYNEPTVFTEYLTDIARLARPRKIRSVLISCGFMNEDPLTEMCEVLDAIKIDLKGFDEEFYRTVCGAELKPVLRSIKQIAASGTHLELVNLVVPTLNDSERMLVELSKWVVGELGPDVPVHFTRFHPDYQLRNLPPTPVATLERAREIAMAQGMHYAFVGNVPGHDGNHTYCPKCSKKVIERVGFFVSGTHLEGGRCKQCATEIAGVWK
jgi:pyruvate formate lyase activating enzyme